MIKSLWLIALLLISGCEDSSTSKTSITKAANHHIEGLVTDRDGPLTSGKIIVKNKNGEMLTSTELKGNANYAVTIPANSSYPLFLEITAPDELLEAVIIDSATTTMDISRMSTLVVRSARDLGGFTKENMARAAQMAIAQSRTKGGTNTTQGFNGDPTKQYGGWH